LGEALWSFYHFLNLCWAITEFSEMWRSKKKKFKMLGPFGWTLKFKKILNKVKKIPATPKIIPSSKINLHHGRKKNQKTTKFSHHRRFIYSDFQAWLAIVSVASGRNSFPPTKNICKADVGNKERIQKEINQEQII
jgi:hypothetical protein